jgi:uncharacterized protein YndB with AHSA1/START domain
MTDHTATSRVTISAPADAVWEALVTPSLISEYMFGTTVVSDFTVGSTITYSGEYEGKPYSDHGSIIDLVPNELLRTTHFSPLSGREDRPENYHTLTWLLTPQGDSTQLTLTQDNNDSEDDKEHSEQNWNLVLDGLKKVVEGRR